MDISKLIKQAQSMQSKVAEAQKELEQKEVTGTSGGGLVKIIMNGKGIAKSLEIDDSVLSDKEMKETLEDLIIAAINDGKEKAEKLSQELMKDATAGMPLPPGFSI
jgi:hypothetical protein